MFSPKSPAFLAAHAVTLSCLFVSLLVGAQAATAEDIRETSSLKFIPADASFYASCLRNREKFDIVRDSKLIAKLLELPPVQMGLGMLKEQWESPEDPQMAMVKELLKDPENAELLELLKDAVSNEIFVYGGQDFAKLAEAYKAVNSSAAGLYTDIFKDPAALEGGQPDPKVFMQIIEILEKNADKFNVPTALIGFKLTNPARADAQIARLHELLQAILAEMPEYGKHLTWSTLR